MEVWMHRIEIDGMLENGTPFKIIEQDGWDSFLVEVDI
jgi:hypothetical protein